MGVVTQAHSGWTWRCLHCNALLAPRSNDLRCVGCGKQYPEIAGVPILVREPVEYVRGELSSLLRTIGAARQREASLARIGREAGLPDKSLDRHRDVINAEIARAEMFQSLLEPAAQTLDGSPEASSGPRPGWTVDSLVPYLLRDWTGTLELEAISARIGDALRRSSPEPSGKSVVFAGCGAGGVLAGVSPEFQRVLGFDLTLPVVVAARHLLDGNSLDLALPRAINRAGYMTLRRHDGRMARSDVDVAAMDALNTAFTDASVDCVVTSFLLDLIPEPQSLSEEIHRILSRDGVWINYGPSGPLTALLRFDDIETASFLEEAGFSVISTETYRSTYLDLSRDCPAWSFQNHICYLTSARKSGHGKKRQFEIMPSLTELPELVPQHFPGARIIEQRSLGARSRCTRLLRHEAIPGRVRSFEISSDTARILAHVDGERTVRDIARLLYENPSSQLFDETVHAFAGYFEQGSLSWRGRGHDPQDRS
jgi:SAM-dependent methyltransferase